MPWKSFRTILILWFCVFLPGFSTPISFETADQVTGDIQCDCDKSYIFLLFHPDLCSALDMIGHVVLLECLLLVIQLISGKCLDKVKDRYSPAMASLPLSMLLPLVTLKESILNPPPISHSMLLPGNIIWRQSLLTSSSTTPPLCLTQHYLTGAFNTHCAEISFHPITISITKLLIPDNFLATIWSLTR